MSIAPIASLLDQWRAARIPALSEQLHLIGDRLPVHAPKLKSTKKGDLAREWLQAVKDEPPHLLSARLRQLELLGRQLSTPMFWPLIEALSKLPPDPRIATFATRVLVGDLRLPLTDKLMRRLLSCVEQHGDDTHYRSLELGLSLNVLGDQLAGRAVRMMQKGLQLYPKGPSLSIEERKRLAATTWELPAAAPTVESLYAPVYEDPRDLTRRQVLADQLLERGHPRGEFISLQLARTSPKRQATLLKQHGEEWLGPLVDVLDLRAQRPIFENGFVGDVTIKQVKQAQFLLAADAKEWATVRRVRAGLQRFSAQMRGLDHAGRVKLEAVRQVVREEWPLQLKSLELMATPAGAVDVLVDLPSPLQQLSLVFETWEPVRWIRDQLPRVAELEGLTRLRLAAMDGEVVPQVLGLMGLEWLPQRITHLELRAESHIMVLERTSEGWGLDVLDLDEQMVSYGEWKRTISALAWLRPSWVRLHMHQEPDHHDVKNLADLLERHRKPVERVELEDVPDELAW